MSDLISIRGSQTLPGDQRSQVAGELTEVLRVCLSAGDIYHALTALCDGMVPPRSRARADVDTLDDEWAGDLFARLAHSRLVTANHALLGIAHWTWFADDSRVDRFGATRHSSFASIPAIVLTSFEATVGGIWLLRRDLNARTRIARAHMQHVNDFVADRGSVDDAYRTDSINATSQRVAAGVLMVRV